MNLNKQPTLRELQDIHAQADDLAGHHILWVDKRGEVFLSCIPSDMGPIGFEAATPSMKIRYETADPGNGYVGLAASEDTQTMERLFRSLVERWNDRLPGDRVEYIDEW